VDRRKVVTDHAPGLAAILGDVDVAGRRPEANAPALRVESVAIDDVVRVRLRQTLAERLPCRAAVVRARGEERAAHGHALVVGLRGDDPRRASVALVDGDREAEVHRDVALAHALPRARAVLAHEHAAVVLLPNEIRL